MNFLEKYKSLLSQTVSELNLEKVNQLIQLLDSVRVAGGRIFFLGVGGSAANASHAVNDFRKLGGFEAYCPTDNVSELTARTNDEGWETVFTGWLQGSRLNDKDLLFIFSVGGGDSQKNVSANLVNAINLGRERKAKIAAIVGRSTGYAAKMADCCIVVPEVDATLVTPLSESFQAVIWHMIISDPRIQRSKTKW